MWPVLLWKQWWKSHVLKIAGSRVINFPNPNSTLANAFAIFFELRDFIRAHDDSGRNVTCTIGKATVKVPCRQNSGVRSYEFCKPKLDSRSCFRDFFEWWDFIRARDDSRLNVARTIVKAMVKVPCPQNSGVTSYEFSNPELESRLCFRDFFEWWAFIRARDDSGWNVTCTIVKATVKVPCPQNSGVTS